jgi:CRISPR system Cascade subunit CasB
LMRASDGDLAVGLRRAIPMVGRTCNVARLGRDLLFWNEITRTRWCFDYFGAEAPREVSEGTQP